MLVEATGTSYKFVTCEKCSGDFYYFAVRTAGGQTIVPALTPDDFKAGFAYADQKAQANLDKRLKEAVDLVKCPHCSHFQSFMIANKKQEFRTNILSGMAVLGFFGAVGGGFFGLKEVWGLGVAEWVAGLVGAIVLAFGAAWFIAISLFSPNDGRFFFFSKKQIDTALVPRDDADKNTVSMPKKRAGGWKR